MTESVTPIGTCTVSWWDDPLSQERRLRIDQADSHVLITPEMLLELELRGWAGEGLFKIEASNGTVRYRLRAWSPYEHAYRAERISPWPAQRADSAQPPTLDPVPEKDIR